MTLQPPVRHHIEEEREETFPKARRSGADLVHLRECLLQRKQELHSVSQALREEALASAYA